jgi:carboxylesterase type B
MEARDVQFNAFMAQANCSDLACLRRAPTEALLEANNFLNQNTTTSGVGFAVVVDGNYVPDLPSRLFLKGRYHKTLTSVIAANNEHEVHFEVQFCLLVTDQEGYLGRSLFPVHRGCDPRRF